VKVTFDNLDGRGAVDYSGYVCASGPLKIDRVLNAPSRCSGTLVLGGSALTIPVRRARVVVTADSGTVLFTGYVATEPQAVYAGVATEGPVYRTVFSAVSDEWLLDKQGSVSGNPALGEFGGQVVKTLANRVDAGLFVTTGVSNVRALGVFEPGQTESWSANVAGVAAASYSSYRALNGALSFASAGSVRHVLSDGDGSLQVAALQVAAVRELANDATVSGEMEPAAYVTERFVGDGTTAVFQLKDVPYRPMAAGKSSQLISESFDEGVFNSRVWNVTDPGSQLGFGALGLAMSGGTGLDGQTTLTAIDAVEMGGTLVVEAGGLVLDSGSDGVVCGLYSGVTSRANCFAGYNVRQSGGTTLVVPFVNGVEVGTAFTALAGHAYTFRIRLHCVETQRVRQTYYAMVDGVVEVFGGGYMSAPMALVFEVQDLGLVSNTPATVLYDGVVSSSPASCSFAAVDSVQLFGSMGYCRIIQTGSAWVVSTPPSGVTATRLIGVAGEGVDCVVSETGLVTFLAGREPIADEFVTVSYRKGARSIARLEDSAAVAEEAAGGMPGAARWLGKVLQPKARCSVDCESAAQAVLSFAANRAAAMAGSYEAVNPADVWPGDLLALTANGATTNVMVRRVSIVDGGALPEMLTYKMGFANDWAEGLGLKLSEAIAADAVLPETALSAPGNVLANLQQLQVVGSTMTALQVDAGVAPPAGGGFEVRRRDWDFGPGVDQDLVLRSPVRNFSIPREGQVERYYVRMYDASTPPVYSRFSSAVFTDLPVS
jgi:hypothetical protein